MLVMHALSQPARSKLWQTSAQRALTASDHTDQSSWSATPSVLSAKKWPMSRNSGFLTLYTINQLLRTQSWCLYEGYSSPDTSGEIKTNHSHFTNSSKIIKPLHVYTKTYLYEENRKKKKTSSIFQNKMKFQDKSCVVLLLSHRLTIGLGGDSRLPLTGSQYIALVGVSEENLTFPWYIGGKQTEETFKYWGSSWELG